MVPSESTLTIHAVVFPGMKEVDEPTIRKPLLSVGTAQNALSSPGPPYVFSHSSSLADKKGASELFSEFEAFEYAFMMSGPTANAQRQINRATRNIGDALV
jgi:hypothetical protein